MNKTALITGATGTIGMAITKKMAELGYNIIFTARNSSKAKLLIAELKMLKVPGDLKFLLGDLGEKKDIVRFASEVNEPIAVMINNAAITPVNKSLTDSGIEMQWAVNVLGYHWMIENFLPHLEKAENPRIVNVASYWAGHLDLSDPEFNLRKYDNNTAYMQSKQANRMLSTYYAMSLKSKGISVNSCHPGDANSQLSNDLGFGGHETPDQAAETPVYIATSNDVAGITGKYFQSKKEVTCKFSQNEEEVRQLYELCQSY